MIYFSRHLKPGLVIPGMLILLMVLTNCRTIEQDASPNRNMDGHQWICEAFQLITYSHEDDGETVTQIVEHNAVWETLCVQKE